MKIKFLKDHNVYKKGDVIDVTPERGRYWVLVKAAEEVSGDQKPVAKAKAPAKAKADKPAAKRKTKELKSKIENK